MDAVTVSPATTTYAFVMIEQGTYGAIFAGSWTEIVDGNTLTTPAMQRMMHLEIWSHLILFNGNLQALTMLPAGRAPSADMGGYRHPCPSYSYFKPGFCSVHQIP